MTKARRKSRIRPAWRDQAKTPADPGASRATSRGLGWPGAVCPDDVGIGCVCGRKKEIGDELESRRRRPSEPVGNVALLSRRLQPLGGRWCKRGCVEAAGRAEGFNSGPYPGPDYMTEAQGRSWDI